jgi:hypothetical protein
LGVSPPSPPPPPPPPPLLDLHCFIDVAEFPALLLLALYPPAPVPPAAAGRIRCAELKLNEGARGDKVKDDGSAAYVSAGASGDDDGDDDDDDDDAFGNISGEDNSTAGAGTKDLGGV